MESTHGTANRHFGSLSNKVVLVGTLASGLGALSALETFDVWNNHLTGTLPDDLGSIGPLRDIELSINQFSGSLPSAYGSLTNLNFFSVWSNQLTGSIPAAWSGLTALVELQLGNNAFSGPIPTAILGLAALDFLYLGNNAISGTIPEWMGGLGLNALELQQNQLTGAVPLTVAQLCASLGGSCKLDQNATLCMPNSAGFLAIGVGFEATQLLGLVSGTAQWPDLAANVAGVAAALAPFALARQRISSGADRL